MGRMLPDRSRMPRSTRAKVVLTDSPCRACFR